MSETFKKGDRVLDNSFLGMGTVTEDYNPVPMRMDWVSVMFDVTPPMQYNMGSNPTMRSVKYLTKIVEGETPTFKVHMRKVVEYTQVVTICHPDAMTKKKAESLAIYSLDETRWREGTPEIKCDYVEQVAVKVKKARVKK